jgi:hypothetical protein
VALKILPLLFLISFNLAFAGNGSSGVGTASIARGYGASNLDGVVERIGDDVIDLKSKEKILNIVTISRDEIDFKKLYISKFG